MMPSLPMLSGLRSSGMPVLRAGILLFSLLAGSQALPEQASNRPVAKPSIAASRPEAKPSDKNPKPGVDNLEISADGRVLIDSPYSSTKTIEAPLNIEKHVSYASSEWWLVYLTGLLVIITGSLAWYTAKLYRATVKLGDDAAQTSHRQALETEKALITAQRAADAATKSAETAEKTAQQQLRAYLYIGAISGSTSNGINTMSFEIKNAGTTGAHRVNYRARMEYFSGPLVENELMVALAIDKDIAHIAPGHTLMGLSSTNENSHLENPENKLYLFGTIVYFDIFNCLRETDFCYLCSQSDGNLLVVKNADIHNRAN